MNAAHSSARLVGLPVTWVLNPRTFGRAAGLPDLRVMRAIPALTRYKRTRENRRKSSKLAHSSWVVLVRVALSLGVEKA
jgi:hypothetical protein